MNNTSNKNPKINWFPLFVGTAIFFFGLFSGYFLRPYIEQPQEGAKDTAPQNPSVGVSEQAGNQEVMEFLIRETRHFMGNPDAPVIMIEFSDFK